MWAFLIAALSGTLMSVQGVFNTKVTETTGLWVSNGWVQLSAFITCIVLWIMNGRDSIATLTQVDPKYMLLGGVMGAAITWTVVKSMSGLGPAKAVMVIVIAQLAVAYLIEVFGIFGVDKVGFEWKKLIGMVISIIGIVIFKW